MITEADFRKIMGVLGTAYPRFQLEGPTIEVYFQILSDLPPELLKATTLHLAATSKWFPAASEIRDAAFELVERQSGVPDATQAWEEVTRELGASGYMRAPQFSHPTINAAVNATGGWRNLCMSTNTVAERARYIQAYQMLVKRERAVTRMLPAVRDAVAKVAGQLDVKGRRTALLE